MFSSITFAPKTTQMGKLAVCDLDLDLFEERGDDTFIMPEDTIIFDESFYRKLIDSSVDQNSFSNDFNPKAHYNSQNFCKKCIFSEDQKQRTQYVSTNNQYDLSLIEESFSNVIPNCTKIINEPIIKKIKSEAITFFKCSILEEIFKPIKSKNELKRQIQQEISLNIFSLTTIPHIEEDLFDNCWCNLQVNMQKMQEQKIHFILQRKSPTEFLPKAMPKLVFPNIATKELPELSSLQNQEDKFQENSNHPIQDFLQDSTFTTKCSKSSQTEDDSNKDSSSKNKLFPTSSKSVTPKPSTDTRKALIIDERLISFPGFQQIFADYRIIFRSLKSYDIEINERTCIIFRPLFIPNGDHKYEKNYHISQKQLVNALIKFEKVFLVISMDDEFKEYGELSENYLQLLSNIYDNQIAVKIRQFPTNKSALNFIHSMVDDSQKFLRDCESLHEHLLSLFPTISKSLAQAILMKGNPIINCSISIDEFPKINIVPFKSVLDTISNSYKKNNEEMTVIARNKKDQLPYTPESESQPSYISGNRKIIAPFPSSVLLPNEI